MRQTSAYKLSCHGKVYEKFKQLFNGQPLTVFSPGRINLIGEHTDYNDGYVLPGAIDKGAYFAFAPSSASHSVIYSVYYDQFFILDHQTTQRISVPLWANYFLGIVAELRNRGIKVSNFHCVFDGDLPTGAGMSSSAAIECGFVFGLNSLFDLNISKVDMIRISQWAEHNFVGVKCGIMDQFASMMGKASHAILLDCRSLTFDYVSLNIKDYCFLLCDTGVKHSLATSEYNTRRKECEEGVKILSKYYPEVKSLRDASWEMLDAHRRELSIDVFKRCSYVVEENIRVKKAVDDIQRGDLVSFGGRMYDTHRGLSEKYAVSCNELDFLVECASNFPKILGSRMMGGGFGGCTLNLIEKSCVEEFKSFAFDQYQKKFNKQAQFHEVQLGDGSHTL